MPQGHQAPTGQKRMVSGLFHSPHRGAFHRSLTVLVHYRSLAVFSLGWWSTPLPARCHVSGGTHVMRHQKSPGCAVRGSHPLWRPVPVAFRPPGVPGERSAARSPHPSNPPSASPAGCAADKVWAPPRSLAATRGILSAPRGTEMFQFPRFPPLSWSPVMHGWGCPIRRPPAHWLPAPPRGVSPRGRVLPRPPTPRHPPCAHLRDRTKVLSDPSAGSPALRERSPAPPTLDSDPLWPSPSSHVPHATPPTECVT